ncbi:MAG: ABC transporter ATP-binding protein [Candidatus Symbiobacter sp.]|nr:ABC transporter ATP-binding protein [Candidatus Symbiobacter sp.]
MTMNSDQKNGVKTVPGQISVAYDHVDKSYDGQNLVVRDLCLAVQRGEFLTLLGPSGSGKTTSLMMLAGFENPTRGRIYLNGVPVETVPPEKRNIGFVFQNYALFPHMNVAENIAFPLRYRGIKGAAARQKVDEALAMVRLSGLHGRKPAQLSGGQQQRVALARALVFDPQLVLMDEPLGALDKQLREQMQFEIKQIHARLGVTFVYVTHDQSEALTLSDRIAVFHDGRIEQIATPTALYDQPQTAFVARFIGENNFFEVTVTAATAPPADSVGIAGQAHFYRVTTQDGASLVAWSHHVMAAGSKAILAIRPERLEFAASAAPSATHNYIRATLEKSFFLGDHLRLQFAVFGPESLIVKAPPHLAVPAMGQSLTLTAPMAAWQIFPPTQNTQKTGVA